MYYSESFGEVVLKLQALYFLFGQLKKYNGINKHAIMCEKAVLTLALSLLFSDVIMPVYFITGTEDVKGI